MTKLVRFSLLLACLGSCDAPPEKSTETFPLQADFTEQGWIVYEGRIPLDEKRNLYMEIFMRPGNEAGEGDYRLTETIEEETSVYKLPPFAGQYSTFHGARPEDLIVRFHNSAQLEEVKRVYYDPLVKKIKERSLRKTDLTFQRQGDDALIMLYQNSEPVSLEARYVLAKRTSRLFTVEGYFEHAGDSSLFLEMNTEERWPVSKLGAYDLAIRQYHLLAREKSEGIYLKGIAYSIHQADREGKPVDALVLKKVIQMTSAPLEEVN
ncbi:hypothetical protein KK083_00330 [Fulvivirgaceae bacterium PWU4]|uniref:Uncharacterized protein n=1 Tax=Chryseosolibacter histidini TaxID=2782349 RepID=A0AAP2DF11_9BACT|nr:hypothetical protein [Chryseosolibacter histidini]MBT1695298.1 hypothetical protein [Chryseosolibacter histidini]